MVKQSSRQCNLDIIVRDPQSFIGPDYNLLIQSNLEKRKFGTKLQRKAEGFSTNAAGDLGGAVSPLAFFCLNYPKIE